MARLKCKNCETFFELNGTEDINCPNCGVKLSNSFTEWRKKKGNENRSFESYKRNKCYPSANSKLTRSAEIVNIHQSNLINNSKRLSTRSRVSKKRIEKNTVFVFLFVFFVFISIFSNPDLSDYKQAFDNEIWGNKYAGAYKVVRVQNLVKIKTKVVLLDNDTLKKESIRCKALEEKITVSNYLFFSRSFITLSGETYSIGTGFWGHIFLSDKIKLFKKT
jgi:uncharacterized Zn finger protein (UPF0148 family)